MSLYRKRSQTKPTTAAGLRAQASANGSSIFGNRPRSIAGLFSSNQSCYSSLLGISPNSNSSSSSSSSSASSSLSTTTSVSSSLYKPSILTTSSKSPSSYLKNCHSNSVNNLKYQHSYTTYGGTTSGYGGLTLPTVHSSVSCLDISVPWMSHNYHNHGAYTSGGNNRLISRRNDNSNRSKTKASSTFGSGSSSLRSLAGSEGYISGNERSGRSSRLGSVSSVSSELPAVPVRTKSVTSENGELDYKKLWEESQAENERLREKMRRSDEQLKEARNSIDKAQVLQNKSSLSEAEKRERRAMERKLSEMEEELKVMEQLKCENQRLKDENGALIRVISKLSK